MLLAICYGQWSMLSENRGLRTEKKRTDLRKNKFLYKNKIIKNTLAQMLFPFWLMRILCFVRKAPRMNAKLEDACARA